MVRSWRMCDTEEECKQVRQQWQECMEQNSKLQTGLKTNHMKQRVQCERCKEWERLELSRYCPSCDQIWLEESMFDFGTALKYIKEGHHVSRVGWNGKGQWLGLEKSKLPDIERDYIFIFTTTKQTVPWVASQTDMLAEDWFLLVQ
jgi:Protein of unknown function (DUF2829)